VRSTFIFHRFFFLCSW